MFGLSKYMTIGLAAIIVVLGIAIEVQTLRLRWAQDDVARMTVEIKDLNTVLDTAKDANDANLNTIGRLQLANAGWAKAVQASASAQATAQSDRDVALATAVRAREAARQSLQGESHENAQCDSSLRVDLGAMCPELRQRLFDRSEKLRPH